MKVVASSLLIFAVVGTDAGRVHHGVHRRLQQDAKANIVVLMRSDPREALPVSAGESTIATTRGERIAQLMGRLESHASATQSNIDKAIALEAASPTPLFESQHLSWIMNARYFQGATFALVEALAQLPEVAEIREEELYDLDGTRTLAENASIPVNIEWGIDRIGAPKLWAKGVDGAGITVGSIDSGVRVTHELLRRNYRDDHGWYAPVDFSVKPSDRVGHGTHTVGTMVGAGGIGVAPGAQWIACQACPLSCTETAIVKCTEWMLCPTDSNGSNKDCSKAPHVINNSWSTSSGSTRHNAIIEAWVAAGIIPVFSNGNAGPACGTVRSPGENEYVLSVGNVDATGSLARSSSRGPATSGVIKPDISAPGQQIASASYLADNTLRVVSGTSMAAPHVAGAVALLLSAKPGLSVAEIRELLVKSTDKINVGPLENDCDGSSDGSVVWPNSNYGHGILDVHSAYERLVATSTWPTPTPTPLSTPAPLQSQSSPPAASPAACTLEPVDLIGNDLSSTSSPTAAQCCSLCFELADCHAFSWNSYNGGTCWFKSSASGARVASTNVVSASVDRDGSSLCRVSQHTDFTGADLTNLPSAEPEKCCALCAERRSLGCRAYTWSNYQGGTCWLKSARGSSTQSFGLVSGEYGA